MQGQIFSPMVLMKYLIHLGTDTKIVILFSLLNAPFTFLCKKKSFLLHGFYMSLRVIRNLGKVQYENQHVGEFNSGIKVTYYPSACLTLLKHQSKA